MKCLRYMTLMATMLLVFVVAGGWAGAAYAGETAPDEAAEAADGAVYASGDPEVWDLVVVGADPEGIAAAVTAARLGLTVALVDHRDRVGGLYTLGALNMLDINYKRGGSTDSIHTGFFMEFHQAMGGGAAFDIPRAQQFFEEVLDEAGVRVFLGYRPVGPLKDGVRVTGIVAADGEAEREFMALRVIDATPDGDVAAAAGAAFRTGRVEFGRPNEYAAATLVFALEGVDWARIYEYIRADGKATTGVNHRAAWGFDHMYGYEPRDPNLQLRGLNLGLQEDETVVINALQIFNVNPLDPRSRQRGMERALAELPLIVEYMRWHCPGFIDAKLAWAAEELYIRESRRMVGQKTLTVDDVFENRFPADTVAVGSYPVDLQSARRGDSGTALGGTKPYGIPFGTLVPREVDNLLVVGKAASFDIIAHGSARTVPVGMSTGQAAGTAVYYSIDQDVGFRAMNRSVDAIRAVRKMLGEQGVNLDPVKVALPEKQHWSYPYIQWLRGKALLSKGYNNDYRLDEPASVPDLGGSVLHLAHLYAGLGFNPAQALAYDAESNARDWEQLAAELLGGEPRSIKRLYRDGVLDEEVYEHLAGVRGSLTHGEAYALLANVLEKMLEGQ